MTSILFSSWFSDKRQCAFAVASLFALPIAADVVSPSTALDIARQYVHVAQQDRQHIKAFAATKQHNLRNSAQRTPSAQTKSTNAAATPPYYLFNDAYGRGFVLVAGDDAMGEVLAYSSENALDTTQLHPGARYLLEGYRQVFDALQRNPTATTLAAYSTTASHATDAQTRRLQPFATDAATRKTKVEPLCKTMWNQDYPYNALLGPSSNKRYPYTGCVATAVAQIMAYHKWPLQGEGQHSYTVPYYQDVLSVNFAESRYDWANMLNKYSYSATETQKLAVAKLMSDVGIALNMMYTPAYSGAFGWQATDALNNYFGYKAVIVSKSAEGNAFVPLIHQEISDGFPVYLDGQPALGQNGHAWVADGYDEKGLTHMNFGWGGQANGYYSVNALSVQNTGQEFQGRPLAFSKGMNAVLAHPYKNKVNTLPIAYQNDKAKLAGKGETILRLPEGESRERSKTEKLSVIFSEFINDGTLFEGRAGLAVYNAQQQLSLTPQWIAENLSLVKSQLVNKTQTAHFDVSQLPDGIYTVAPICQPKEDIGSDLFYPIRKTPVLEFEVKGNQVFVKNEFYMGAGYTWNGRPFSQKPLRVGHTETLYCPIRTMQGHNRNATLHISILDEQNNVVFQQKSDPSKADLTEFETKQIPIVLHFPKDFKPGTYHVKAVMKLKEFDGIIQKESYDVANVRGEELPTIEVKEASTADSPLPTVSMVMKFRDSGGNGQLDVITNKSDVNFGLDQFFRIVLNGNAIEAIEGRYKYYLEEEQTLQRIPFPAEGYVDNIKINAGGTGNSSNLKLDITKLKVESNKKYRLVMVQLQENGEQRELPFARYAQRNYEFWNAHTDNPIEKVYIPQPHDFFTLALPTKQGYVVAPSPRQTENSTLSMAQVTDAGAASQNIRAIFYREGDHIISLSTGRALQFDSEEYDWDKALSFAPYTNQGTELQWVQQDGMLRPRGMKDNDHALSTPLQAERVDVLPIATTPLGWGTFFAPVQGTVTNGTAYRAVEDADGMYNLVSIDGEIPAGTAFIVKSTPSSEAHFVVSRNRAAATAFTPQENAFFGALFAPAPSAEQTIYGLSATSFNFARLLPDVPQRPFRAFLSRSSIGSANNEMIFFNINPTGIHLLPADKSIYGDARSVPSQSTAPLSSERCIDLSGREVKQPRSGEIYILRGKKVVR